MRLLLIEDNDRLAGFIVASLAKAGFVVDRAATAAEGDAALRAVHYEVVVLDLGLPDDDGLGVLAAMRGRGDATSVIVLTARDGVGDRVVGLNKGADDYMMKPFAMEELVARIRVQMRRPDGNLGLRLVEGNLIFDTIAREVFVGDVQIGMTRRELDALEALMRRAGKVVSKAALEEAIYAFGEEIESNALEVLIYRLRKRLQQNGAQATIQTVRGVGYFLSGKD
jgi:DNA-binding response OmpR family regulator